MDAKPLQSIWKISGPSVADTCLSGIVSRRSSAGATELYTGSVRKSAPARQQPGSDFVEALAHGLALLECWTTTDTWLTNAQLSERSGLTRPNVTRLCAVLLEHGYLVRERERGRLRLTALTLNLGVASAFARVPVCAAKSQLARLARELDVYVALSVRVSDRIQIVQNAVSPHHPNAVHMDVGGQLPICTSASGLALLCSLSANEALPVLQRLQWHYGDRWSLFERHLQKTRLEYSKKGYCASVSILSRDVGAVAVPIVTSESKEIFVLACGMPAREFYPERIDRKIAPSLLETARQLKSLLAVGT